MPATNLRSARAQIRAGLGWLTMRQSSDALGPHLGIYADSLILPGIRLQVIPEADGTGDGKHSSLCFTKKGTDFTPAERSTVIELVGSVVTVLRTWDSLSHGFSLSIDRKPGASLLAALNRYRNGCPEHKSVFCSSHGCDWWQTGHGKLKTPAGWWH